MEVVLQATPLNLMERCDLWDWEDGELVSSVKGCGNKERKTYKMDKWFANVNRWSTKQTETQLPTHTSFTNE